MKNYTWIAIENAVTMICFTAIAIIFKEWWIILFSALFITTVKTKITKEEQEDNQTEEEEDHANIR